MFGIKIFVNRSFVPQWPAPALVAYDIIVWWVILLPVIALMRGEKITPRDIGFTKKNLPMQVVGGIAGGVITSALILTIPALLGHLRFFYGRVDGVTVPGVAIEILLCVLGVGMVEECIFRGYIYRKLLDAKDSKWLAILVSSVLFGLSHILNGNPIQIVMTTVLGIIWSIGRARIPNFTLLSLVIAHGLHDALLPVVAVILQSAGLG